MKKLNLVKINDTYINPHYVEFIEFCENESGKRTSRVFLLSNQVFHYDVDADQMAKLLIAGRGKKIINKKSKLSKRQSKKIGRPRNSTKSL